MTGDFSRKTFDPAKDYSLVRMQQGRLFTDADWNEQADILRAGPRDTTADVIGHAGFPEDDPGFGLIPDPATGDLVITAGAGYVAGVRHEARTAPLRVVLAGGAGLNATWRIVSGLALVADDLVTTDPEGLSGFVRVRDLAETDAGPTFRTTPALNTADGRLVVVPRLGHQPFGPPAPSAFPAGDWLACLKSTERPVTALDDPAIREVAFDGPDTAIRDRTLWQVRLYSRAHLTALGYGPGDLTCPALADGFDPVIGGAAPGTLAADSKAPDTEPGPCALPPAAGYRSLDNRLYRVEIHTPGDETAATWKWSRDNAIHRTRYTAMDAGVLIVDSTGRDQQTELTGGDWIEIRSQDAIDAETPGFFARIDEVVGTRVSLAEIRDPMTLAPLLDAGQPDTGALPSAAFVTRWEGGLPAPVAGALAGFTELELGVRAQFSAGAFQTGDHWTIPARTVTGDVDWPRDPATDAPVTKPPEGPRRDYAALAWLDRSGGAWSVDEDCRPFFAPLTDGKRLHYAGGDGQEALPDPLAPNTRVALPKVLSAAVLRGHAPLAGETVRFSITEGDGRFANGQTIQEAATDAQGNASVAWSVDATNFVQRAIAQRLDTAGNPTHHSIAYTATLSRADRTSFDPANTPALAGANTVQKAIEALAGLQQIGCTTYIIREGMDWVAVLEGLKPGENASICFARGTYQTAKTVRLSGLGNIGISGAGAGTVQIVANRVETALGFEKCASVSVSGVEIATPDGNSVIPDDGDTLRQGALDLAHCATVAVGGCHLRCGGGTSPMRTCLSVRGYSKALGFKPTQSVTIRDNRFTCGQLQEALVVTDAVDTDISGNQFTVRPRKTGAFPLDAFLADKVWVAGTVKNLVAQPVKGKVGTGGGFREIAAKEWRMTFNSPVPQRDWDDLIKRMPPADTDLGSAAAFERYANTVIGRAAADPALMPAFEEQLKRTIRVAGTSTGFDDPKVRRTLLVASDPSVHRFDAKAGALREVVVEANGQVVSFNSPFSQQDWNRMIAKSEAAPKVANADELLGLSFALAEKAVVDKGFRAGLGSVGNWLGALVDNGVSMGQQAIVCAGRRLDNVTIRDNVIREYQTGIRVAVSFERQRNTARRVLIENNRMELITSSADAYAPYGVMVGNVDSLRITGNDMRLSKKPNFTNWLAQGIRVWGYLGFQILIAENRIATATMGVRVNNVDDAMNPEEALWILRENLVLGPKGVRLMKATPNALVDHNNRALGIL